MKNILLIVFGFFVIFQSKSQEKKEVEDTKIYKSVQKKAEPKEGLPTFLSVLANNLDLTSGLPKADEVLFKIQFVVEKDGTFSNFEIKGEDHGYAVEAFRVLKTMPAWKPAEHNGAIVRTVYTLPIKLRFPMRKLDVLSYNKLIMDKRIENRYFKFDCDCNLISNNKQKANKAEEFSYTTTKSDAFYSIVLKEAKSEQIAYYIDKIKSEVEKQNGNLTEIVYHDLEAIETDVVISNGNKPFYSWTLYFIEGDYFVSMNVLSSSKEVSDFTFEGLKESFQFKK